MNTESNIPVLSHSELLPIITAAYPTGLHANIVGGSGCGKTYFKDSVSAALSIPIFGSLNLTNSDAVPLRGVGIPNDLKTLLKFICPEDLPTPEKIKELYGDENHPYLWEWDEVNNWPPNLLALLHSLVVHKGDKPTIAGHPIAPNFFVYMTGNRRKDGTTVKPLPGPFVYRTFMATLRPDPVGWVNDFICQENPELVNSPVVPFISFTTGMGKAEHASTVDHFAPDAVVPWNGEVAANPRSWEKLARATLDAENMAPSTLENLARCVVGNASGDAFYTFAKTVNELIPIIEGVRDGTGSLPKDDLSLAYRVGHAAKRVLLQEIADRDPGLFVANGSADWFMDNVLLDLPGDIGGFVYDTTISAGVPLDQHPKGQLVKANR